MVPSARSDLKTILVLDDDPQFHRLVRPVLTSRGHRVLSAHTGAEATQLVKSENPHLIIVDGQLPEINGIDWISALRAEGNDAIIMFVSAYWRDAHSYHRLTKELGVALVLHKPVLAPVFAAEVDILLGKGPSSAEPPQVTDFEDTLLALRSEYAKELPGRLQDLTAQFEHSKGQPDNVFLLSQVRTVAHKLRGTAASYGFPEIGRLAGEIEDQILRMNNSETRAQAIESVQDLLEHTLQLAESAAQETNQSKRTEATALTIDRDTAFGAIAKILLVDDDAAFLDLVDELARENELEVVRASNPSEALDMACMTEIDAAFIDVDLGARDLAFGLALDLRSLPGYGGLPLAFLHGAGHIEQTIEVENVGECLYINKEMKPDALHSAVRRLAAIKQSARPKVLLIDDDPDFSKSTAFVLTHEGMQVRTLDTSTNILEEMENYAPDALLLDVMMPGVSGFDICRMLRTIPRWRDLPILFLTAYTDVDTRVACLKCGGDDFLLKPIINEELLVRLKMRLERARLLKERMDRDPITDLLNRKSFMEDFSGMIAEARRHSWSVAVCLLQVRHEPRHQPVVADTVLNTVASILRKRLRPEYLKGRWDNDKFILAFRQEDLNHIHRIVEVVAGELGGISFTAPDGSVITASLTYGIASTLGDGRSVHELIEAADRRLNDNTSLAQQPGSACGVVH